MIPWARHSLLALVAAFAVVIAFAPEARADRVDKLVTKLRTSKDYKVRLSAALNLAKIRDKRAIPAFLIALSDKDKTVRGVAAASLAKVVDSSVAKTRRNQVLSALKRSAARDKNRFVRKQAQKAYDVIKRIGGSGGGGGGGSIYVDIGPMSIKAKGASKLKPLMKRTITKTFKKKGKGMMIEWPGGGSPSASALRKKKISAFHVDGTITSLTVTKSGGSSLVACKLSMLMATYPKKSMFGFLNGGAKVQASSSAKDIEYAKQDCVAAVVEDLIARKIIPTIKSRAK